MFDLARIQIFREIPLKVEIYDHLNAREFHTFVYERKAFALQFDNKNSVKYPNISTHLYHYNSIILSVSLITNYGTFHTST